eukprot:1334073-Rhodomonas_salina.3
MRVGLKRTAYKVCRRSLILVVHAMPLSSAGARPVKRSLNLAVAARELAAARLSSEEAKKQKLDMQSVSIVRDVGCANSLMPAGERKALAVISANIQSTTPSVLHDAGPACCRLQSRKHIQSPAIDTRPIDTDGARVERSDVDVMPTDCDLMDSTHPLPKTRLSDICDVRGGTRAQ